MPRPENVSGFPTRDTTIVSSSPRPPRNEPPDVTELKTLRRAQPDLASAIDLQLSLLALQRRVRARVPLPATPVDTDRARDRLAAGRRLLEFDDIPLDWTDYRLIFREMAELLYRHDALDENDHRRAQQLGRESDALEPSVVAWYNDAHGSAPSTPAHMSSDMLAQIILLAMRPFLSTCAEALLPTWDLSHWQRRYCPLCGGEPDFATITPAAERLLICSRCTGQWPFHPLACPFCENDDRTRITSFASRDGRYRIYACDRCRRYLKAYDARHASRPAMVQVDSIASLPFDAAAMQKGYKA